ncbi:MAG: hypothetical protein ACR2NY_02450 [Alphaproteobacteria bacterium]
MLNANYLNNLNLSKDNILSLSNTMREQENFSFAENAIKKAKLNPQNDDLLIEAFCEIQGWGGYYGRPNEKRNWQTKDNLNKYKEFMIEVKSIKKDNIPDCFWDYFYPNGIKKIKGVAISFGSKHLKFINNNYVVYDSIIAKIINDKKEPSPNGYKFFHKWCLKKSKVTNTKIYQVEEAVWHKLYPNYCNPIKREEIKKWINNFKNLI